MSGVVAPGVRPAVPADLEALAAVLARAFDDDPPTRWMVRRPTEPARRAATHRFYRAALRHMGFPVDGVLATDDGAGVLLYAPPGRWSLGPWRTLRMLPDWFASVGASRLLASIAAARAIERLHPPTPHFYVFAMGVLPEAQGRGLGAALLRAALDHADRAGAGTWLEATTRRSMPLYARHGFEPAATYTFPEDGPTLHGMWRPAPADAPPQAG